MKSTRISSIWTLATFLVAILILIYGSALFFDVRVQQKEVREKVSLISRLDSLEQAIQELGDEIFDIIPEQPVETSLEHWRNCYFEYFQNRAAFFGGSGYTDPDIQPFLQKIDSSVIRMDAIFAARLLPTNAEVEITILESSFRNEMNFTGKLIKESTELLRNELNDLSISLASTWHTLITMVMFSGFIAILMAMTFYLFYRKIYRRKRIEKALFRITAEFRAIFKSIPDAVIFTDNSYDIVMVNPGFTSLFGYNPEEVMGKQAQILFNNGDDFKELLRNRFVSLETKKQNPYEVDYQGKNGNIFIGETVATMVKDVDATPCGFFCIIRDITERKRAEKALSEAHHKLELWVSERTEDLMRANDEVRRFAYVVSHDLRAPLVNIKGFAGELRHAFSSINKEIEPVLSSINEKRKNEIVEILQEEIPEALQFIDSSASRMGNLIDAVLKLSRLGRRELHFERINVRVLVRKVLESLAHQIEQRKIVVRIGALPRVVADQTSFEQIVGNILVNAINYLEPGRRGEIEIAGKRHGHETIFYIKDNGRGISEEDMHKVFEPFSRAGRQDVPGEGMGLAYVQTLVRRHGGRIWCESKLAIGTKFYFAISNYISNGDEID